MEWAEDWKGKDDDAFRNPARSGYLFWMIDEEISEAVCAARACSEGEA